MVPQKTRTGPVQILALIRPRMTHWEEIFQTWWAEQIKLLLTCSVCGSDYGLLPHLAVCNYRLFTYFPSTLSWISLWGFPKYSWSVVILSIENNLLRTCLKCLKYSLFTLFPGGRSSEFLCSDCNLWQLLQAWWRKPWSCTAWGHISQLCHTLCKWLLSAASASSL